MDIRDKIVLITGGARIGREVAFAFAERGAHVALTYRHSKQSALETQAEVQTRGQKAIVIKADLSKKQSAAFVVREIKRAFGKLNILIHMASLYESKPLVRLISRDLDRSFAVHFRSAYELALQAIPLLKRSGDGRIIFVTDWTVESGRPRYKNLLPYYAAKAALKGLSEVFALELAPQILVNSIAPGPILPPRGLNRKEAGDVLRSTPLKRWGESREIAKAAIFLAESDFVTGEAIRVDGGRHLY